MKINLRNPKAYVLRGALTRASILLYWKSKLLPAGHAARPQRGYFFMGAPSAPDRAGHQARHKFHRRAEPLQVGQRMLWVSLAQLRRATAVARGLSIAIWL